VRTYPLYFSFTNIVKTDAFHAAVLTKGRALLIHHQGEYSSWVCSGVQPGGLDAEGEEAIVATKAFAQDYQAILDDIAGDALDFDTFAHLIATFFAETNEDADRLWASSVTAIRSGHAAIDPSLSSLERKPDAEKRGVHVMRLPIDAAEFNDEIALATDFDRAA
jgi:hypothetical protein